MNYGSTVAASAAILIAVAIRPAGAQMTSTQRPAWDTRLRELRGHTLFLASNRPVDTELFDPSGGHSHEQHKRRESATIFPT